MVCFCSPMIPQVVAPDAIKQKGHIAGRAPEPELRSDPRVGLAERTPVPEGARCVAAHSWDHLNTPMLVL
jgi:hypothetical protein